MQKEEFRSARKIPPSGKWAAGLFSTRWNFARGAEFFSVFELSSRTNLRNCSARKIPPSGKLPLDCVRCIRLYACKMYALAFLIKKKHFQNVGHPARYFGSVPLLITISITDNPCNRISDDREASFNNIDWVRKIPQPGAFLYHTIVEIHGHCRKHIGPYRKTYGRHY